ncbi:MAG: hypothetical protein SFT90_04880 [Rickettsiales bacterium]|nr:hypothetical protein [Rickettsiales bacterium]
MHFLFQIKNQQQMQYKEYLDDDNLNKDDGNLNKDDDNLNKNLDENIKSHLEDYIGCKEEIRKLESKKKPMPEIQLLITLNRAVLALCISCLNTFSNLNGGSEPPKR